MNFYINFYKTFLFFQNVFFLLLAILNLTSRFQLIESNYFFWIAFCQFLSLTNIYTLILSTSPTFTLNSLLIYFKFYYLPKKIETLIFYPKSFCINIFSPQIYAQKYICSILLTITYWKLIAKKKDFNRLFYLLINFAFNKKIFGLQF